MFNAGKVDFLTFSPLNSPGNLFNLQAIPSPNSLPLMARILLCPKYAYLLLTGTKKINRAGGNLNKMSSDSEFSGSTGARHIPSTGDDASFTDGPTRTTTSTFAGRNLYPPKSLGVGRKGPFQQGHLKSVT